VGTLNAKQRGTWCRKTGAVKSLREGEGGEAHQARPRGEDRVTITMGTKTCREDGRART